MVADALVPAQHGIETLRIEIAIIDLVPGRAQALDHGRMQRRAIALGIGVGIEHENAHA